jgi:curved DNA-binding protein CbpA
MASRATTRIELSSLHVKLKMAESNLYKLLDVSRAASAAEIKAAHRKLVKKYHPDLFSTRAEKEQATANLQQINRAYAILGNPERRRQYDEEQRQKPSSAQPVKRTSGATRSPSRPVRKRSVRKVFAKPPWKVGAYSRWGAGILGVIVLAVVVHVFTYQPEAATAWMLLQRTNVESSLNPSPNNSTSEPWMALHRSGSRAECSNELKEMVKKDEREGSKAIVDEQGGALAITVYIKDEATLAREYLGAKLRQIPNAVERPPEEESALRKQATEEAKEFIRKNGINKRTRHYECRATQLRERESWLRRQFRRVGLVS